MSITFDLRRFGYFVLGLFVLFCLLNVDLEWGFFGEYAETLRRIAVPILVAYLFLVGPSVDELLERRGHDNQPSGISQLMSTRSARRILGFGAVLVALSPFLHPVFQAMEGKHVSALNWVIAWTVGIAVGVIILRNYSRIISGRDEQSK